MRPFPHRAVPKFPAHPGGAGESGAKFLPDGMAMAKSLGGGFPMGAFWVRAPYADLLGAGTQAPLSAARRWLARWP